jgi:rhodanese-related sulfurtransferase
MKVRKIMLVALLVSLSYGAYAQQAASAGKPAVAAEDVWKYQAKRLDRPALDALLAHPAKILVIDVRRPDEVVTKGSFPVYLSVQAKDLEKNLEFIPKDRTIVTLSNHAHRAGAVADLLASKGFSVAGAAGSEDYEAQGGSITRIAVPASKVVSK